MTHQRNTAGLRAAAQQRSEDAYRDVKKALQRMIKQGVPITAAEVARQSGRSARYVQTHPEFGPKIRKLSNRTPATPFTEAPPADAGTIATLRLHIRTIKAEHQRETSQLREELQQAHATIERLTATIITLQEQQHHASAQSRKGSHEP